MLSPNLSYEYSLWQRGYNLIAGVDEVGRGSWAGPVVSAAVILPKDFKIPTTFGDSKQLKPNQRVAAAKYIQKTALAFCISEISVLKINKFGIGKAVQFASIHAIRRLIPKPDFILCDAFFINQISRKNQLAIKKGDQKSASIAAASIIAKVYRDNLMKKLSRIFPQYGFAKHKGYGTKIHQEAIIASGLSKIHRTSFDLKFLKA